jgi:hypothetical protein
VSASRPDLVCVGILVADSIASGATEGVGTLAETLSFAGLET